MALNHNTLTSLFNDTANAIRSKTGSTAAIVADNFPNAINSIVTVNEGTSTATATNADILSPKTAYANGVKLTGIIPTKTAADLNVVGPTVTAPAGYYAKKVPLLSCSSWNRGWTVCRLPFFRRTDSASRE